MLYYTKHATPIYTDMDLPITIVGSGSAGNSVLIKPLRLLIDAGFAYKHIDAVVDLDQVDFLAMTHEHGDHFNAATLKRIAVRHPHITILMPERLYPILQEKDDKLKDKIDHRVQTFPFDKPMIMETRDNKSYVIQPHSTEHGDITNVAYEITYDELNTRILYATDLDTFDPHPSGFPKGLPQGDHVKFNLIFLEANYDEDVLNEYIEERQREINLMERMDFEDLPSEKEEKAIRNALFRAKSNLRHVSEQEAIRYVGRYLTEHGIFIPMHASRTFGTYFQDMAEE